MKHFNLKTLIFGVVAFTFCLTIAINLWSASRINTDVLIENTLENNRVYAQKLASTADRFIEETFTTLSYSANFVADKMEDEQLLAIEVERLRTQNEMFNSVIVANKDGLVLGVSPPSLELKGEILSSAGPTQALNSQVPLISKPYTGMTDRLIIFISHPIFSSTGDYLGLIGGSIYIKEDNVFHSLLGQHYYDDGSYVYVVDEDGRIIYHKDPNRLNDIVPKNEVVTQVIAGKSGAQPVTNTAGTEMLAGYSPIEHANWGIVSQRPKEAALAPINEINKKLVLYALPFILVALILVLWMAVKIAKPINQMAKITAKNTQENAVNDLHSVSSWYYEARTLKDTLLTTLSALHNEVLFFREQSSTDGLTGLLNRRTLDEQLKLFENNTIPFAILMLDIDHFKKVNDTFGHAVGDEVLKYLAQMMKKHAESDMLCYRYGGEEFVILQPNRTLEEAMTFAESLRQDLEQTISPCGYAVKISGGVALFPQHSASTQLVIEKADAALYEAKQTGRNRIANAEAKLTI